MKSTPIQVEVGVKTAVEAQRLWMLLPCSCSYSDSDLEEGEGTTPSWSRQELLVLP